jgi:uncharacterized membrane protein YkoI
MNLKVTFIIGAAALVAAIGCGSSSGSSSPSEIDEGAAKQKATALLSGGTATTVTKIDEADEHRWAVEVRMPNGAPIVVELDRKDGMVMELVGEKGPFDYDFAGPSAGYMKFSDAKAKAVGVKQGTVELWEINLEKSFYEFYVRDSDTKLWEIKLDPKTGAKQSIEQKDKPD